VFGVVRGGVEANELEANELQLRARRNGARPVTASQSNVARPAAVAPAPLQLALF
jgi:hypothetical protein